MESMVLTPIPLWLSFTTTLYEYLVRTNGYEANRLCQLDRGFIVRDDHVQRFLSIAQYVLDTGCHDTLPESLLPLRGTRVDVDLSEPNRLPIKTCRGDDVFTEASFSIGALFDDKTGEVVKALYADDEDIDDGLKPAAIQGKQLQLLFFLDLEKD